MRCPDCGKFVQFEEQDPEDDLDVEVQGENELAHISGTIRCVLACAECCTELKQAEFDVSEDVTLKKPDGEYWDTRGHPGSDHELELEIVECENTETGGSRYKKNLRGFRCSVRIQCHVEHCDLDITHEFEDSLPASQWDELI